MTYRPNNSNTPTKTACEDAIRQLNNAWVRRDAKALQALHEAWNARDPKLEGGWYLLSHAAHKAKRATEEPRENMRALLLDDMDKACSLARTLARKDTDR